VFISTIGAIRAHYGLVAYDSSKGALELFTARSRLKLAEHGIRVNSVAPGSTRVEEQAFAEEIPIAAVKQPLIRCADPAPG